MGKIKFLGIISLVFVLSTAYQVFASYLISPSGLKYPNPGHYPEEIGPGSFNCSGNANCYWEFPGNVNVSGEIHATGDICTDQGGGICLSTAGGIGGTTPIAQLHIKATDLTTVPFQVEAPVFVSLCEIVYGIDLGVISCYRRPITIDNTRNSNTLTDYQVLVTLDTASLIAAGKMRPDCGDIRFTDSDGTSLLNYWIESGCNSGSTKIWVKVPSIPASATKTIYVYYGNPSASSESNGDAVFEFFDDFNSLDTTKWNAYRCTGDTINELSIENGVIYLTRAVDGKGGLLVSKSDIIPPFIVKFRYKAGGGDGADGMAFGYLMNDPGRASGDGSFGFLSGAGYYGYLIQLDNYLNSGDPYPNFIGINNINNGIPKNVDGSVYQTSATEDNQWHTLEAALTEDEVLWVKLDGSTIISSDTTPAPTGYYKIGLGAGTGGFNNNHIIDYLIIRKYASPEPTVSIGAEETPEERILQKTVFYIQNVTGNVGIGTASPTEKLDVVGNIKTSKIIDRDNTNYYVDPSSTSKMYRIEASDYVKAPKLCIGNDCRSEWPKGCTFHYYGDKYVNVNIAPQGYTDDQCWWISVANVFDQNTGDSMCIYAGDCNFRANYYDAKNYDQFVVFRGLLLCCS